MDKGIILMMLIITVFIVSSNQLQLFSVTNNCNNLDLHECARNPECSWIGTIAAGDCVPSLAKKAEDECTSVCKVWAGGKCGKWVSICDGEIITTTTIGPVIDYSKCGECKTWIAGQCVVYHKCKDDYLTYDVDITPGYNDSMTTTTSTLVEQEFVNDTYLDDIDKTMYLNPIDVVGDIFKSLSNAVKSFLSSIIDFFGNLRILYEVPKSIFGWSD